MNAPGLVKPPEGGVIVLEESVRSRKLWAHVDRVLDGVLNGAVIAAATAVVYLPAPTDVGPVRLHSVLGGLTAIAMIAVANFLRRRGRGLPPPQPDWPTWLLAIGIAMLMTSIVSIVIRSFLLWVSQLAWAFLAGIAASIWCVVMWKVKPEKHPDSMDKFEHWITTVGVAVALVQGYKYI